jgi:hypothetical protein
LREKPYHPTEHRERQAPDARAARIVDGFFATVVVLDQGEARDAMLHRPRAMATQTGHAPAAPSLSGIDFLLAIVTQTAL